MEGVANHAIVHANYYTLPQSTTTPLLLFRPAPPMAAIDRFLHGRAESTDSTHHFSLLPPPPPQRKTTYPSSSSTLEGFVHRFSPSRDDDVDVDGGTIADMAWPTVHDVEAVVEADDILVGNSNTKRSSRREKGPFIKGQWTDYEDSKLVELVEKYGTRKWSQIAMKLVGRAGKQCRERWHNHLRPDIKKDSWDEKEERLLVEAHLQFGNKWAEIARRIPGRSENSIKNHWNATKRRQNSKRKSKKKVVSDPGRRTSMLQKYIKSLEDGLIINLNNFIDQNSNNDNVEAANMAVVEACPAPPSPDLGSTTLSGDPSRGQLCNEYNLLECSSDEYYESSINIDDSCHDEVVFMQNLFNTNNVNNTGTISLSLDDFENRQLGTCNVRDQTVGATTSQNNVNNANNYSDWMVYSLLEGAVGDEIMTSNDSEQSDQIMAADERYGSGGEWKDMDLYELVSANYSQFSQASSDSSD